MLLAGLVALRNRMLANLIGTLVFLTSLAVGILGSYFHLQRAILPNAPAGEQISTLILLYAPPLLGPLTFALVAVLGISAAWQEEPVDSGRLHLLGDLRVSMPLPKTRAYFLLVALFILVTLISSVLDHARTNFENPWLWLPTVVGAFATFVTLAMGASESAGARGYHHLYRGDGIDDAGGIGGSRAACRAQSDWPGGGGDRTIYPRRAAARAALVRQYGDVGADRAAGPGGAGKGIDARVCSQEASRPI